MKRIKEEAEVIIRLDFQSETAHVCVSAWPRMASKLEKLYGSGLDSASGQARRWTVPLRGISFRKLARKPRQGPTVGAFAPGHRILAA